MGTPQTGRVMGGLLLLLGWIGLAVGGVLETIPPGTWMALPGTTLRAVEKPASAYADYAEGQSATYNALQATTGFAALISAWSGAAYDPGSRQYCLWGGGHNDYAGNEVYCFSLDTLAWTRQTDPWPHSDPGGVVETSGWGWDADHRVPMLAQPRATHIYNVLQFVPLLNRFCAMGSPSSFPHSSPWPVPVQVDCWSPVGRDWWRAGRITDTFTSTRGSFTARAADDPATVYVYTTTQNPQLHQCTFHTTDPWLTCRPWSTMQDVSLDKTAVLDGQQTLWAVGGGSTQALSVAAAGNTLTPVATTGATGIEQARAPGVQKVVAWSGGRTVFVLDPLTQIWTSLTAEGGETPSAPPPAGTFGRFACDERLGIAWVVNSVEEPVWFYRFPAALQPPPPVRVVVVGPDRLEIPLTVWRTQGGSVVLTVQRLAGPRTPVTWTVQPPTSGVVVPTTCLPTGPEGGQDTCTSVLQLAPQPGAAVGSVALTIAAQPEGGPVVRHALVVAVVVDPDPFATVGALTQEQPPVPEQVSLWMPFLGPVAPDLQGVVRFRRQGTLGWHEGGVMGRVVPEAAAPVPDWTGVALTPAGLAWPLLGLEAGQPYEVEVTLQGGGETQIRQAVFQTRAWPGPAGPVTHRVTPAMGHDAIQALLHTLTPGHVVEFAEGDYVAGYHLDEVHGTPEAPIVLRGASRRARWVHPSRVLYLVRTHDVLIENLTLVGPLAEGGVAAPSVGVFGWADGFQSQITLRDLVIMGVDRCIEATRWTGLLVRNVWCEGTLGAWTEATLHDNRSWNHHGIVVAGQGNVVQGSTIRHFGDCLRLSQSGHPTQHNTHTTLVGNDLAFCHDDGVEGDHGMRNVVVMDNRFTNVMTCLSWDPLYGGPFVYAYNLCVNPGRMPFKWTDANAGGVVAQNTIVSTTHQAGVDSPGSLAEADLLSFFAGNPQTRYTMTGNIFWYAGPGRRVVHQHADVSPLDLGANLWACPVGRPCGEGFRVQDTEAQSLADLQPALPPTEGLRLPWTQRFTQDRVSGTPLFVQPPAFPVTRVEEALPGAQVTLRSVSSAEPSAGGRYAAAQMLDGRPETFWHTEWVARVAPLPHRVVLDVQTPQLLSGLTYLPRQDGSLSGTVTKWQIALSGNASRWTLVAKGTWPLDAHRKTATWPPTLARYVRLTIQATSPGDPYANAAEVTVLRAGDGPVVDYRTPLPVPPTYDLTLLPTAVARQASVALPGLTPEGLPGPPDQGALITGRPVPAWGAHLPPTPPSVTLAWDPGVLSPEAVPPTEFHLFRRPNTQPPPSPLYDWTLPLLRIPALLTTALDLTADPRQTSVCYVVTAWAPSGRSAPSNEVCLPTP